MLQKKWILFIFTETMTVTLLDRASLQLQGTIVPLFFLQENIVGIVHLSLAWT